MTPSVTSNSLNILFVASGRRVSLIESFRGHLGPEDKLYGTDTDSLVASKQVLDGFFIVPSWGSGVGSFNPEFKSTIEKIVQQYDISLVVPLMDDAAEALRFADFGSVPMLGSRTGIDYDKRKSNSFFTQLGLEVPEIVSSCDSSMWPVIGRPVLGGTGSRGTCVIESMRDFRYYYDLFGSKDMMYSRFIEGPEYTVDCFKDFDGNLLCVVPRKRLEVRNGEVQKGKTVRHPEVIAQATKIAQAFDFTGLMCVQCIEGEEGLYWLEMNARFGGGAPLSIVAGADSPGWIIQMLRGETTTPITTFKEVTMLRADREFYCG